MPTFHITIYECDSVEPPSTITVNDTTLFARYMNEQLNGIPKKISIHRNAKGNIFASGIGKNGKSFIETMHFNSVIKKNPQYS